jgi:hypothetical protein
MDVCHWVHKDLKPAGEEEKAEAQRTTNNGWRLPNPLFDHHNQR